ncbi:protein detoxification 8 [Quercus suber]|uniref:Protein detoxification 8 n=1 Tax=Quercus suber TaxID=58331 RepID=A0AAW0KCJ6_QUESU
MPLRFNSVRSRSIFSVTNNDLFGLVLADLASFDNLNFDRNDKLCEKPLGSKCGGLSSKSLAIIITAGVVGTAMSLFIGSSSGEGKSYGFGNGGGFKGDSSLVELLRNMPVYISKMESSDLTQSRGCECSLISLTKKLIIHGVARGSGWQDIGAYVNLGAYYLIGVPVGVVLVFVVHLKGRGLWTTVQCNHFECLVALKAREGMFDGDI